MYGPELSKTITKKTLKNDAAKRNMNAKEKLQKTSKKVTRNYHKAKQVLCWKNQENYQTIERFEDRAAPEIMLPLIVRRIFS